MYSATKAAVIAFTQALRVNIYYLFNFCIVNVLQPMAKTDGVRVNCICPTWINTDMGRMVISDSSDRVREAVKCATLLR